MENEEQTKGNYNELKKGESERRRDEERARGIIVPAWSNRRDRARGRIDRGRKVVAAWRRLYVKDIIQLILLAGRLNK